MKTDLLIKNANVLTLDSQNSRAGSIAVTNGKISGIWLEADPPKHKINTTANTEVVDLNKYTIIPGFIETHNHILMYSQLRTHVDCSTPPNESISDIVKAIGNKAMEVEPGEWIEGFGYDDTLLYEKRHPTRYDLDKVSPNNPVIIKHISWHFAVANSIALQMAGLNDKMSDPKGGHLGRDERGRLNGVLFELSAINLVTDHIPKKTIKDLVKSLGKASKDYVAQGITTNTDAGIGFNGGIEEYQIHIEAAEKRLNPMRSQLMIMHHFLREGEVFGNYTAKQLDDEIKQRTNGLAKLDSAKFFQDGSIQGLTGALRKPYYKFPNVTGELIHKQIPFTEEIVDLHKRGFRIATHGNGDRAIESILDAYKEALEKYPRTNHRHRIEHVQTATFNDLINMRTLGVAGSFFVNHVYYWGDRHENVFLGPERARRISPLADAIKNHLLFTLHSDCPVTPISPLFSVWAAVNRITREGKVLGADQRINVETALKAMTINGATLNFDENRSGSIELGKNADFAILEVDPTTIDPKEIKDIKVVATFIGGQPVYGGEKLKTY